MAYQNPYTCRGNNIVRDFDGVSTVVAAVYELYSLRRETLVHLWQRLSEKRGELRSDLRRARCFGYLPELECELAAINRVMRVLHDLLAKPTVVKMPQRPLPPLRPLPRLFRLVTA